MGKPKKELSEIEEIKSSGIAQQQTASACMRLRLREQKPTPVSDRRETAVGRDRRRVPIGKEARLRLDVNLQAVKSNSKAGSHMHACTFFMH